ncbi:hypothetical protein BRC65_07230 [Halobacteriales archaeon QH_2_65_14]|nr:MAG: hypothetical protein BRC65_07230 [Halobacteriales archaeon QH_2_65_14]
MMETYPTERLYEEVAFIAYHFNWSRQEVMSLPHQERQRWCEEISAINEEMNTESQTDDSESGGMTLTQAIDFGDEE